MPALAGATAPAELRDSTSDSEIVNIQPAGTNADYQKWAQTDEPKIVQARTGDVDEDGSASRVLPTVNKKTDVTISNEGRDRLRVTVRGWDAEKKEAVDNLEKNAKSVTDADENIVSAEISPEEVKVSYKRPAKLFGFIPVAYYHAFTVDGKGNVSHGTPWWLAFATDDASTFGADVAEVFQHNQSDLRFIKMQTVMEQQLQRFSALSNVMKARHEAAMNSIRNMK